MQAMLDSMLDQARFNMIEQQVRPWQVLDDRVLTVMGTLPRERFVPDAYRGLAYADIEIPLGGGAAMLAPKVAGRLLQALAVQPGERVLEIGTGTGYLTACLAELGGQVVSVEIAPDLAAAANARLNALGERVAGRVRLVVGDALADASDLGPAATGPFDAIVLTGSIPTEEPLVALRRQLATGGRLVAILGTSPLMQARLETCIVAGDFRRQTLFETSVAALVNAPRPAPFVF